MMILEEGGGQKQLLMMTVPSQCPSPMSLLRVPSIVYQTQGSKQQSSDAQCVSKPIIPCYKVIRRSLTA